MERKMPKEVYAALSTISAILVAILITPAIGQGFKPEAELSSSNVSRWVTKGQAQWRLDNGVLVGRATGGNGGWLVSNEDLQDLAYYSEFRCVGKCNAGVLLRSETAADGSMSGIYVSLSPEDVGSYRISFDAKGQE